MWVVLYQWRTEKAWLVMNFILFPAGRHCLWHHWHRLLGTKWRLSWSKVPFQPFLVFFSISKCCVIIYLFYKWSCGVWFCSVRWVFLFVCFLRRWRWSVRWKKNCRTPTERKGVIPNPQTLMRCLRTKVRHSFLPGSVVSAVVTAYHSFKRFTLIYNRTGWQGVKHGTYLLFSKGCQ